jgi:hypothetical protein
MKKAFRGKAGDPIRLATPPTIPIKKTLKPLPGQLELFGGQAEPRKPQNRGRKLIP